MKTLVTFFASLFSFRKQLLKINTHTGVIQRKDELFQAALRIAKRDRHYA